MFRFQQGCLSGQFITLPYSVASSLPALLIESNAHYKGLAVSEQSQPWLACDYVQLFG
jgi:hypothetical protein